MRVRPMRIEGAFEVTPVQRGDPRGLFLEWYRLDRLEPHLGYPMRLAQANLSVSGHGVLRGIHYAQVPPGQAKYVCATVGAVLDVVVDLRLGSPTFGRWETVRLDETDRRAVYLAEGLGHGFCVLSESATLTYLCSQPYQPAREHAVHPLDPELAIAWPVAEPVMSERDAGAPNLAQARRDGLLPSYLECRAYQESLRAAAGGATPQPASSRSGA
jgi:dTDP-4-dehydrorhamnose 3,5-epimerase